MGIRMSQVTPDTLLDLIALRADDIIDAVVTRKGNRLQISHVPRGNYVKRRLIVTVKEELYDV